MSKVICDVCGTTYPETATQCPICGTAKNGVTQTAAAATADTAAAGAGYSYVKGGRFSEKNVRRRTSGNRSTERRNDRKRNSSEDEKSNVGLIIIVIILLIAIIAVVVNLVGRYLGGNKDDQPADGGSSQVSEPDSSQASGDTTASGPATVPCESMELSSEKIQLLGEGDTWKLSVRPAPENTTDEVTFTSSDPAVVSVDSNGLMTAVGHGEATVTVTCGSVTKTCTVICSFGEEPTEPSGGEFVFAFNTAFKDETTGKYDTTITKAGETWRAYTNDLNVAPELITWISDDPNVCTVDKGIVTAVGPGRTEIHAQYNGITYTCVVRCAFKSNGGENNDTPVPTGDCTISHEDVTIAVGESFTLRLKDSNGNTLEVTWSADKAGHVAIKGNKITGEASINGYVTVSTTYEGVTYSCKVRVR